MGIKQLMYANFAFSLCLLQIFAVVFATYCDKQARADSKFGYFISFVPFIKWALDLSVKLNGMSMYVELGRIYEFVNLGCKCNNNRYLVFMQM